MKKGRLRPILGNGRIRYDWWKSVLSKDFIGLMNRTGCGGIVEGPIRSVTGKSFPFGKNHEKKTRCWKIYENGRILSNWWKHSRFYRNVSNGQFLFDKNSLFSSCWKRYSLIRLIETSTFCRIVLNGPFRWDWWIKFLSNCWKRSTSYGLLQKKSISST